MAAWRYASQDYRTFSDHLYENDKINHQSDYDDFYDIGRKNSLSANIMQPLSNNLGNVSLSALWRNYWGRSGNAKDGSDSNLLIVFYVQIMPDDLVMQLHRF